jgi:hypothetical protein
MLRISPQLTASTVSDRVIPVARRSIGIQLPAFSMVSKNAGNQSLTAWKAVTIHCPI